MQIFWLEIDFIVFIRLKLIDKTKLLGKKLRGIKDFSVTRLCLKPLKAWFKKMKATLSHGPFFNVPFLTPSYKKLLNVSVIFFHVLVETACTKKGWNGQLYLKWLKEGQQSLLTFEPEVFFFCDDMKKG